MSRPITPWQSWSEMLGILHWLHESMSVFDVIAIETPEDVSHPGMWWLAIVYGEGDPGAIYIPRGDIDTDQALANIEAELEENPDRPRSARFLTKALQTVRNRYAIVQVLP